MKFCAKCGNDISENGKFCKKCGNPINYSDIITDKTKNTNASSPKYEEESTLSRIDNEEEKEFSSKIKESFTHNKEKSSNIMLKIVIGVILAVLLSLSFIFFNRIKAQYYMFKCNFALTEVDKIEYATEAVKAFDTDKTKNLFEQTILNSSENNVEIAETNLEEVSSFFSKENYKSIASYVKGKKLNALCCEGRYSDAVLEFDDIYKLGGDFKSNKNYNDIMLHTISKLTGTDLSFDKDDIMKNGKLSYVNLDDDYFDEIVELNVHDSYYYFDGEIIINLYEFTDGKYNLADTTTFYRAYNGKIVGICDYATNKKGVFINYQNNDQMYLDSIAVLGVNNNKLDIKGIVSGGNYASVDDDNKDGIYEIFTSNTNYSANGYQDIYKWFQVYDDGSTPTEVKTDFSNIIYANNYESEYVFQYSDRAYLTEYELLNLSKEKLAFARNEIFARHGYVFQEKKFKDYFESKSWYLSDQSYDGSDSSLNIYEIANYKLIKELEKR